MTDKPLEVGPRLDDQPLTKQEVLRAFRLLKRRKVSLAEVARQLGYKPVTLSNLILMERFGPRIRARISWLLRALVDGRLVVVPAGGKGRGQLFLPSGKALKDHETVRRLERCVCGRYAKCPCLAHKPLYMKKKCPPLHSDAAGNLVDASMTRRQPSQDARTAAPLGASGSLSGLRYRR